MFLRYVDRVREQNEVPAEQPPVSKEGDPKDLDMLKRAHALAAEWHKNDKRKVSGVPYIIHPERVEAMLAKYGAPATLRAAAFLHDVIEDALKGGGEADRTAERQRRKEIIQKEFPPQVWTLISALSKGDESKDAYLSGLKQKGKEVALIKLADRLDNLRDGYRLMGKAWVMKYLGSTMQVLEIGHANGLQNHPLYKLLYELAKRLREEYGEKPVHTQSPEDALDPDKKAQIDSLETSQNLKAEPAHSSAPPAATPAPRYGSGTDLS